jgi:hypothetical protein
MPDETIAGGPAPTVPLPGGPLPAGVTKDQPLTTDPTTGQPTPATNPEEVGGTIAGGDPDSPREQPKPGAGEKPPEAVREQGQDEAEKPAEGEKPKEGDKPRGPDGKFAAKPPDYAAEIKAPEGLQLDPDMLGKAGEVFAKHKLPVDTAQELVDLYGATLKQVDAQAVAAWKTQVDAWGAELKADKDFGGHAIEQTRGDVAKAIEVFGGEDGQALRNILNETGVGNHPALVRLLARAGRAAAEDRLTPAGGRTTADPLRALYPSMFQGT